MYGVLADVVCPDTRVLSRPEWLELRRGGLGGSEAATVLEVPGAWGSRWALWAEKTGLTEPEDVDSELMRWGRTLEDVVAREAARRYGWDLDDSSPMLRHREHPFMLANPDRFAVDADGLPVVVEVKVTDKRNHHEWEDDELPPRVIVQVAHYLAVTQLSRAWVAVLVGGNDLRVRRIDRDLELEALLVDAEREFWDLVVTGTEPDVDGLPATTDALNAVLPALDEEVVLDDDGVDLWRLLHEAKQATKTAKAVEAELANQLRARLGTAEIALAPDGRTAATWRETETTSVDLDALRQDHGDLVANYTRTRTTRRLLVKTPKD